MLLWMPAGQQQFKHLRNVADDATFLSVTLGNKLFIERCIDRTGVTEFRNPRDLSEQHFFVEVYDRLMGGNQNA